MAAEANGPPRLADAPWLTRRETQAVFAALAAGGHESRAVGGVVRNALLGRPVADVDIATTAPPAEVMRLAEAAGFKALPTGIAHGTVTLVVDHLPFEVTTLREDVETYGRHATVAFIADWAADARRRDFTMNALYCAVDGTVHDPLGGYPDLAAGRVRFIGDATARIREDYLRILRFFRFHAEYGRGPLDRDGLLAAVRERHGLAGLSGERVRQELMRLLSAAGAVAAVEAMLDHGLVTGLLPVAPRPGLFRKLVEVEQAQGLAPDAVLRLAAFAVEIPEDAERLRNRLRLSNDEFTAFLAAASRSPSIGPATGESAAKAALYRLGAARYRDRVLVSWARSACSPRHPELRSLLGLSERWTAPRLPVTGVDVVARGVPPGPRVGEILRALEERWIAAGFAPDRQELLEELGRLTAPGVRPRGSDPD
jgi:poly(A) polymerase